MSLKDQLQSKLAGLSPGGPHVVQVTESDKQLTCEVTEASSLAYRVDRFVLATGALASVSMDQLEKISEALSSRLTYLLEPVGPIERDHEHCVVQMRSNPPQQDEDGTQYYELLVRRGGELELRRYQKAPGQPRQTIPALLTTEVLLRLAEDFEAVV